MAVSAEGVEAKQAEVEAIEAGAEAAAEGEEVVGDMAEAEVAGGGKARVILEFRVR